MKRLLMMLFGPRVKKTSAGEIAKMFGLELVGDPKTMVTGIAPIADAKAGDIAFYSTERNHAVFRILPIETLKNSKASVIILQPENKEFAPKTAGALLITPTPRVEVIKIIDFILAEPKKRGISLDAIIARGVYFKKKRSVYIAPFAVIEKGAVIEEDVQIMSGAYIGKNCRIGKGTVIHPNAVIENATIGEECVIHGNASIGKDGFGYTRQDGINTFIPHAGRVVIGNRVSIGASTCVDRGLMTDTTIGDNTKIDNLVQIAHGVRIGQNCFLAGCVGIAGGCVIGDRVMIAGGVGLANKVNVGDDAGIGAGSGVMRSIPSGEEWMGYPALPAFTFMRMTAWLKQNAVPKPADATKKNK